MKQIIDTHAHIYSDKFQEDLKETIKRASAIGVTKILMPNIDSDSIDAMHDVNATYPEVCLPMMGVHPCSIKDDFRKELEIAESWLSKRDDYVAIGEMGIDLYWDKIYIEEQKEAFKIQCDWAKSKGLPVVIHSRDANPVVIELLKEVQDGSLKGVLHCFSGSLEEAEQIVDLGMMLGVGGISTFKNGGLDKVLPHIPIEQLIVETDAPYLAPTPFRGKRNEPVFLEQIVDKLSDFKEVGVSEVCRITTMNAQRLFQLTL